MAHSVKKKIKKETCSLLRDERFPAVPPCLAQNLKAHFIATAQSAFPKQSGPGSHQPPALSTVLVLVIFLYHRRYSNSLLDTISNSTHACQSREWQFPGGCVKINNICHAKISGQKRRSKLRDYFSQPRFIIENPFGLFSSSYIGIVIGIHPFNLDGTTADQRRYTADDCQLRRQ